MNIQRMRDLLTELMEDGTDPAAEVFIYYDGEPTGIESVVYDKNKVQLCPFEPNLTIYDKFPIGCKVHVIAEDLPGRVQG